MFVVSTAESPGVFGLLCVCVCDRFLFDRVNLVAAVHLSQEIHNTRTPTTNLTYESTLGLPTKHVY